MIVVWSLLYLWVFWLLYVLVMGLYRAWLDGRLKGAALVMALPVVVIAYFVDLFANWTLASLAFWEAPTRPRELVTDRLSRYVTENTDWRYTFAKAVCDGLLDYFDPSGKHCK